MTREEWIKKNKASMKKQGFEYDEKTGEFTYVEPIEYLTGHKKSGTKKKTASKKTTSKKK